MLLRTFCLLGLAVSCSCAAAADPAFELGPVVKAAMGPEGHYGFPRLVRAKDGRLLTFYRIGNEHAAGNSSIGVRHSTDDGKSWSDERIVWRAPDGTSAHNPVAIVARSGEVILWISRYVFSAPGRERQHQVVTRSTDHGQTWSQPVPFDASTARSSYYMTDAIQTSGGLLACDAAFPPSGGGACFVQVWHSDDDGKTWRVIAQLTKPDENYGDEVGLLETSPGTILCILRHRNKAHPEQPTATWRLWSKDGGKSWTPREDISASVGKLQRPFLTRLDERTVVLSGRGGNHETVAFLSRDNGQTFGNKFVLDTYQGEGGYTAAVPNGPRSVVICWHSDEGEPKGRPDIKVATLKVVAKE
jgi:hypothetical protein